jgi:hypothetical protein
MFTIIKGKIFIYLFIYNWPQWQIPKLMWHIKNTIINKLMKLGGSLGDVPQKMKKLVIKTRYISDC